MALKHGTPDHTEMPLYSECSSPARPEYDGTSTAGHCSVPGSINSLWVKLCTTVIGNSSSKISISTFILLKFKARFGPLCGQSPTGNWGQPDLWERRWEVTFLQLVSLNPHVSPRYNCSDLSGIDPNLCHCNWDCSVHCLNSLGCAFFQMETICKL